MSRKYENPPVLEAVCELHFSSDTQWDEKITEKFFERIKDNFPNKQEQIGFNFQIFPTERGIEQKIEPAPPKTLFFSQSGNNVIQLVPYILIFNQLRPYTAWEDFKLFITSNLQIFREIAKPITIEKVVVRYIKVFDFFETTVDLKEYYAYYPSIPETLPNKFNSFLLRIEFPQDDEFESLTLSLGNLPPKYENSISIVLDIEYFTKKQGHINFENLDNWLEQAHQRIEETFEECITEKLRALFNEKR